MRDAVTLAHTGEGLVDEAEVPTVFFAHLLEAAQTSSHSSLRRHLKRWGLERSQPTAPRRWQGLLDELLRDIGRPRHVGLAANRLGEALLFVAMDRTSSRMAETLSLIPLDLPLPDGEPLLLGLLRRISRHVLAVAGRKASNARLGDVAAMPSIGVGWAKAWDVMRAQLTPHLVEGPYGYAALLPAAAMWCSTLAASFPRNPFDRLLADAGRGGAGRSRLPHERALRNLVRENAGVSPGAGALWSQMEQACLDRSTPVSTATAPRRLRL